jgi:hypothetical protein
MQLPERGYIESYFGAIGEHVDLASIVSMYSFQIWDPASATTQAGCRTLFFFLNTWTSEMKAAPVAPPPSAGSAVLRTPYIAVYAHTFTSGICN